MIGRDTFSKLLDASKAVYLALQRPTWLDMLGTDTGTAEASHAGLLQEAHARLAEEKVRRSELVGCGSGVLNALERRLNDVRLTHVHPGLICAGSL